MKAIQLRAMHMTNLVGKKVQTEAIGDYPGGVATVIEIFPDPSAPEIAFNVKHPTFGEIGIFSEEECALFQP